MSFNSFGFSKRCQSKWYKLWFESSQETLFWIFKPEKKSSSESWKDALTAASVGTIVAEALKKNNESFGESIDKKIKAITDSFTKTVWEAITTLQNDNNLLKQEVSKLKQGAKAIEMKPENDWNSSENKKKGNDDKKNVKIESENDWNSKGDKKGGKKPDADKEWLNYAHTQRAKDHIKEWLREQKKEYWNKGEEKLKSFCKKYRIRYNVPNLGKLRRYLAISTDIDLMYKVANGMVGEEEVGQCFGKIKAEPKLLFLDPYKDLFDHESTTSNNKRKHHATYADGSTAPTAIQLDNDIENVKIETAQCCKPVQGDQVKWRRKFIWSD